MREMLANIAKGSGAQQGVGNGVQHDIGIAVSGEAAAVGNRDSAEHHRSVTRECMNVEAHAGPWDQARREPLFGALEVGGHCELFERRITLDRGDDHACRSHDTGFISGRGAFPLVVGRLESTEAKRLGRLHASETGPIDGLVKRIANPCKRVPNRQDRG
jgi:hypothetical protein